MRLHNVMEDLVEGVLSDVLARTPEACPCDRCRLDMKAFALNNLPARYAVDDPGEVHRYLESLATPFRSEVLYNVTMALQIVAARPRHARSVVSRTSQTD